MYNQSWNAQSAMELVKKQAKKKEKQIQTQLSELHKQTVNLI